MSEKLRMSDCDKVLKNLYRLMEGDPAAPLCVALKEHLKTCEGCARYHNELKNLVKLCRSSPKTRMPGRQKEELRRFLLRELSKNGSNES